MSYPLVQHVVQFSGGLGSWATARRVADNGHRPILLCADTNSEADDWQECVDAYTKDVDGILVQLGNDDRDVWDVFNEQKFIGNTRADICSRVLKREPLRKWLEESCDPAWTVVYIGFDWTEAHRLERARPHWVPWTISAPLCDPPYFQKADLIPMAEARGLPIPQLYRDGFSHNNCGGACVKAGQAQWEMLLRVNPTRYRREEAEEEAFRERHQKDVSILRDRTRLPITQEHAHVGTDTRPLTLRRFRERLETQPSLFDASDWGACSCMETAP